jgi:hypothetical protein
MMKLQRLRDPTPRTARQLVIHSQGGPSYGSRLKGMDSRMRIEEPALFIGFEGWEQMISGLVIV